MQRKFTNELIGVLARLIRFHIEFLANFIRDPGKRRTSVRCLPDCSRNLVQREESRVRRRHHHHFVADQAGRYCGAPRDVFFGDFYLPCQRIISQTRLSGANINRQIGTRSTN